MSSPYPKDAKLLNVGDYVFDAKHFMVYLNEKEFFNFKEVNFVPYFYSTVIICNDVLDINKEIVEKIEKKQVYAIHIVLDMGENDGSAPQSYAEFVFPILEDHIKFHRILSQLQYYSVGQHLEDLEGMINDNK